MILSLLLRLFFSEGIRGKKRDEFFCLVGFGLPLIHGERTDMKKNCRFKEHLLLCMPDADSYI